MIQEGSRYGSSFRAKHGLEGHSKSLRTALIVLSSTIRDFLALGGPEKWAGPLRITKILQMPIGPNILLSAVTRDRSTIHG